MEEIRDCFNTARDHGESAETLTNGMDTGSYGAGYTLPEYADALEAMGHALLNRANQVRDEID